MRKLGRWDAASLWLRAIAGVSALLGVGSATADEWKFPTAAPEAVGVDSRALVRLSSWIRVERLDVRALLIVKDGRLIFERYSQGVTREHNHAIYSVTKSITSTLIGMLVDDGRIAGRQARIADVLAGLPQSERLRPFLADKGAITVGDVLSMATGIRYAHDPERHPIYTSPDRLVVALSSPASSAPNARFNYSDGDASIAGALVVAASGKSLELFARERLFTPLGMRNVEWPWIDRAGLHPGGCALRLRAIDMAKFGQLMLDGGVWNGQRLVSASWIESATARKAGPSYGYFWWTDTYGERSFTADGFKGQKIIVLPRRKLVIVLASVLPRDEVTARVQKAVREFIIPATESVAASAPNEEQLETLRAELPLAQRTKGDPRNTIAQQDMPRR